MTIFVLPMFAKDIRAVSYSENEIAQFASSFPDAIYFFARLEPMEV